MGKLIPRLIGLFPKLEGEKNQLVSEVEEENQYKKKRERSEWKGPFRHFSELGCTFADFFGCLAWIFFFCVLLKR